MTIFSKTFGEGMVPLPPWLRLCPGPSTRQQGWSGDIWSEMRWDGCLGGSMCTTSRCCI